MRPIPSPILAIADGDALGPRLLDSVEAAVRGGLRWICLRLKSETEERCRETVRAVRRRCPEAIVSLNGSLDAAEGEPVGLHLPSNGPSVAAVRERFPGRLVGVSCHSRGELERAAREGADYALLSPFLAPISKPSRGRELGVEGFRRACGGLDLSILALGGVTIGRVAAAAGAGASGIAVLGSLFLAADIERQAAELLAEVREVFSA